MNESQGHFEPGTSDPRWPDSLRRIGDVLDEGDVIGDVHDEERAAEVKRRDLADERRSSDKDLRDTGEELELAEAAGRREPGVELEFEKKKDTAQEINKDIREQKAKGQETEPPA